MHAHSSQEFDFSKIPSELIKLLAEIGFFGISLGFTAQPKTIFEGIVAVRPNDIHALVGKATADVMLGNYDIATEALIKILQQDPHNDVAKSFLAISYFMQKKFTDMKKIAENLIASSKDLNAINVAKGLLEKAQSVA